MLSRLPVQMTMIVDPLEHHAATLRDQWGFVDDPNRQPESGESDLRIWGTEFVDVEHRGIIQHSVIVDVVNVIRMAFRQGGAIHAKYIRVYTLSLCGLEVWPSTTTVELP